MFGQIQMASLSSGIGLDAALVSIFSNNSLQVVQVKISGEAFVAGKYHLICWMFEDVFVRISRTSLQIDTEPYDILMDILLQTRSNIQFQT